MREISPALDATADEFFAALPPSSKARVTAIREQKASGRRIRPSATLIDQSLLLSAPRRAALLDLVAQLVDENLCGRSEMCEQFAVLLTLALNYLGITARPVSGDAIYFDVSGQELFRWRHSWVRAGDEVIDGNVDILGENPAVPNTVRIAPYWGSVRTTPRDRRLREGSRRIGPDGDVQDTWWPDLKQLLDCPSAEP